MVDIVIVKRFSGGYSGRDITLKEEKGLRTIIGIDLGGKSNTWAFSKIEFDEVSGICFVKNIKEFSEFGDISNLK